MRGKAKNATLGGGKRGITPACAGKSDALQARVQVSGDHPRVCGEKFAQDVQQDYQIGSPPRVRGKAVRGRKRHSRGGITPACAGKSGFLKYMTLSLRDHPRVCGEKARTLIVQDEPQGSPPRVRGKAKNATLGGGKRGITPACAGKSLLALLIVPPSRDHPRVCGEKAADDITST